MSSIIRSTPFSLDDGGAIVKTILGILFIGILCSMLHLVYYPSPSELSKAEVNIDFGDSGDSITASATIRVEAPVDKQDDDTPKINLLPSLPDTSLPDVSLQMPRFPSPSLPKCCHDKNLDCSWLEHIIDIICKFREDAWNMMVNALLSIRYIICKFREDTWNMMIKALLSNRDILKELLILVCDFLALLSTTISSLIQYVDCNTSSSPWDGCSSKLLRDALDFLDAKDKIVLSWIPVESSTTTSTGLSMVSRILISFATMLGFMIIIVLCIFFENSPGKDKIVQKIGSIFANASTKPPVDEKEEKQSDEKKTKKKMVKAVKEEPSKNRNKSKSKKKSMKKKPKQADKTEDTIARIDEDIKTEG